MGNYFGLPFENNYIDEPVPFLVDRIYTHEDDAALDINRSDWRGYIPIFMDAVEGAFADDDTEHASSITLSSRMNDDYKGKGDDFMPNLGFDSNDAPF